MNFRYGFERWIWEMKLRYWKMICKMNMNLIWEMELGNWFQKWNWIYEIDLKILFQEWIQDL